MSSSPRRSRQATASVAAPIEMCSVRVGDTLFGLPISHILEIVGSVQPQAVPLAPGFVGGLVHYRGDVLITVNLRYLLGLPTHDNAQPLLVLEGVRGCFGVLVDGVGEVLTVSPEDYEPNPSTLDECLKKLFTGTYKLKDRLLVILEPSRLDPLYLVGSQAA
ncbi:chemotaxis protein CheW [Telmatobacter sp. DSM 110680]|uniref:Chemotaxis protein CheW n=1 Tax=Telmatobacter sp. DSM 110680 TaxID=3036704 RepID=A0AAU7DHV8_9BACT